MSDEKFNNSADSDSTRQALAALALRLPNPKNYYAGRGKAPETLPANILVFHRRELGPVAANHHHYRYVLHVNLGGAAALIVDEAVHAFRPGQALLVHPYQFHGYADVQGKTLDWLLVTFEGVEPQTLLALRDTPVEMASRAWCELTRLAECFAGKQPSADEEMPLRLALLLQALREAATPETARPLRDNAAHELIATVNHFVWSHLAEPLALADVAAALAISESHLRNRFREVAGVGLGRYIRHLRLQRACRLLATTDLTVSAIAEACGFQSLFAFSRAFKRIFGASPQTFRTRLTADSD